MVNPMSINYDYYRIFYYVAKYKSFTQAANVLMNSQPNITRSIKNLERELGCTLFTRSNRQVQLTPEGESLYRHAAVAFDHLSAGEEEIARGKGLDGGILRIAATEVSLRTFLLPVLKEFRSNYPGIHIKVMNDSTPAAINDLQSGLADLAVVTTPTNTAGALRKTTLCPVQEVAVCGSAYAHLSVAPVSLAQLTNYPIISLGELTQTYEFYSRIFSDHDLILAPDIEAATADQILPMVKADLGIGFVPEAFLQGEDIGKTVFPIPLVESIPLRKVCLLTPIERPLGPAARELERALIAASNSAVPQHPDR